MEYFDRPLNFLSVKAQKYFYQFSLRLEGGKKHFYVPAGHRQTEIPLSIHFDNERMFLFITDVIQIFGRKINVDLDLSFKYRLGLTYVFSLDKSKFSIW